MGVERDLAVAGSRPLPPDRIAARVASVVGFTVLFGGKGVGGGDEPARSAQHERVGKQIIRRTLRRWSSMEMQLDVPTLAKVAVIFAIHRDVVDLTLNGGES